MTVGESKIVNFPVRQTSFIKITITVDSRSQSLEGTTQVTTTEVFTLDEIGIMLRKIVSIIEDRSKSKSS